MSLSCRQQRLLRRIDDAVSRSDPRLASMLAFFGRLTAGEEMPGREQLPAPALSRFWAMMLMAAAAGATLITRAAATGARAIRFAAASTALAGRLVRDRLPAARVASSGSPAAGTRTGPPPGHPGLSQP